MPDSTKPAQRVFITGGCGDIGRAIASRFLAGGARVVVSDVLREADGLTYEYEGD